MSLKNKFSIPSILLLASAAGLFGVIFIGTKRMLAFTGLLLDQAWISSGVENFFQQEPQVVIGNFISPVRGIIFIVCFTVLAILIWQDVDRDQFKLAARPRWNFIVLGFIGMACLSVPVGLIGMANEYADMSLVLFSKVNGINWGDRFLLPALAHVFFFRGPVFYYIFSLICILGLLYCVSLWFARNNITISYLEFLSLGTISFIAFQFYSPGYPDVLVLIFILLVLTLPLGENGWLALFVLSMATHEASLFIWVILAFFMLDRRSWYKFILITGGYFLFRYAGGNFNSTALSPNSIDNKTPLEWLVSNPGRELLGIFFAFKAGWVMIVTALAGWLQKRAWRDFLLVTALLAAGFGMTILGIDTSRLMGWAFPALLLSWKFLSREPGRWYKEILKFSMLANLLIPPFYVALYIIDLPAGLYKLLLGLIS